VSPKEKWNWYWLDGLIAMLTPLSYTKNEDRSLGVALAHPYSYSYKVYLW
jgi:hypothetical protein